MEVELYAPMIKNIGSGFFTVEEGCSLESFLKNRGVENERDFLILINNRRVPRETALKEGDRVSLLILLSGG